MIAFFAEVIQFFSFFHHLIKRVLDPDSLDPQHFCFQDPDPDPTGKISTKNCEKNVLLLTLYLLGYLKTRISPLNPMFDVQI